MTKMQQLEQYRRNMRALDDAAEFTAGRLTNAERVRLVLAVVLLAMAVCVAMAGAAERKARTMKVRATAYCPCRACTDGDGVTATGTSAFRVGVAVDPEAIQLGARIDVPGIGSWIRCDDTGRAIKGNRIDIRMQDHEAAVAYGVRMLMVRVWE